MGPADREQKPAAQIPPSFSFFGDGSKQPIAPSHADATASPARPSAHSIKTSAVASTVLLATAVSEAVWAAEAPAAADAAAEPTDPTESDLLLKSSAPPRYDSAVIWLHGLGETGTNWASLGRRLRTALPTTRLLCPTAPKRPMSCYKGKPMHAWFDVNSMKHTQFALDPPGLAESSAYVQQLVWQQIEDGILPERIVLVGFSQGGSVLLDMLCQGYPGINVAAVLIISAFVASTPPEEISQPCLPLHFFHGDSDKLVPVHWARSGCEMLQHLGVQTSFRTYEQLGHGVHEQEVQDVLSLLVEVLGATAAQHVQQVPPSRL